MTKKSYFALAITGPTASGKTALSLAVAKHFGAQILSCDSMQIYRGMDIGTAKATAEERAAVVHHLIDIVDVGEPFPPRAIWRNHCVLPRLSTRGGLYCFLSVERDSISIRSARIRSPMCRKATRSIQRR